MDVLADIVLWAGNLFCSGIEAAWAPVAALNVRSGLQWFARLDAWAPVHEMANCVGVSAAMVGFAATWKVGVLVIGWIRG